MRRLLDQIPCINMLLSYTFSSRHLYTVILMRRRLCMGAVHTYLRTPRYQSELNYTKATFICRKCSTRTWEVHPREFNHKEWVALLWPNKEGGTRPTSEEPSTIVGSEAWAEPRSGPCLFLAAPESHGHGALWVQLCSFSRDKIKISGSRPSGILHAISRKRYPT